MATVLAARQGCLSAAARSLSAVASTSDHASQLVWPPSAGAFAEAHPELIENLHGKSFRLQANAEQAATNGVPAAQRLESNLLVSFNSVKGTQRKQLSRSSLRHIPVNVLRAELQRGAYDSTGLKEDLMLRVMDILSSAGPASSHSPTQMSQQQRSETAKAQQPVLTKQERLFDSPQQVAQMLQDAHCDDVSTVDVRRDCDFADFFILSTARSHDQLFAAANAVVYQSKLQSSAGGQNCHAILEGQKGSDWLVVDAGNIIVHVFLEAARRRYDLERLWGSLREEAFLPLVEKSYEEMTLDDL